MAAWATARCGVRRLASAQVDRVRFHDDPVLRDFAVAATTTRIRELSWEHQADRLAALIKRLAPDRLSS